MPSLVFRSVFAVLLLGAGCASTQSASSGGLAKGTASEEPDRPMRGRPSRAVANGPSLDRQGCDPTGKSTVVEEKGDDGHVKSWKYFSMVRRSGGSVRVLKCE